MASWRDTLAVFLAAYGPGFALRWEDDPSRAAYPIGQSGATTHAQLCRDADGAKYTIAAKMSLHSLHSIAHEVGHAMVMEIHGESKFDDEHLVGVEQIAFLTRLASALLRERVRCHCE